MTVRLLESMVEISLSVSAVLLALFLLEPLLKKRLSVKWRYWIWLVLAVRLLIPLNLHLPQPPVRLEVPQGAVFQTASLPAEPQSTGEPAARTPVAAAPQTPEGDQVQPDSASGPESAPGTASVLSVVAGVWLAGAALLIAQRFAAYFAFRRGAKKWSRPAEDAETLAAFGAAKAELNLKGAVELRRSGRIAGPMIAGFFRPLLLLPERELPPGEMELILRHELIHWKRRDVWYRLLLELACAVHWFNPLVWRMVRKAGEDAELVCDSLVVEGRDGEYRRLYGEAILAAVRPGKGRRTVFSTGFSGGARTMKRRLWNIFDTGKKRRGAATFCIVLLAAGVFGASVACGAANNGANRIDNIALLNAGNSYLLEDGKFVVSYHGGKTTAVVPLDPGSEDSASFFNGKSVYLSDEISAVAYGGAEGEGPVTVLVSDDKGKNWSSHIVTDAEPETTGTSFVGFSTKENGWLVTAGYLATGYEKNRVFVTSDGGNTWTEIGNTTAVYPRVVTGAAFLDEKTGFLSFRYDIDVNPVVYRTEDGGKTWAKCKIELPESLRSKIAYSTAEAPAFCGRKGVLPIALTQSEDGGSLPEGQSRFVTEDGGKTWTYDLAPIPADSSPSASASGAEAGSSAVGADATPIDPDLILSGLGIDPTGCPKIEPTDPSLPQSVVQYYAGMDRPAGSTKPALYRNTEGTEYMIAFENPDGEGEIHCLIYSGGSQEPTVRVMTGLTNVQGNDELPRILYAVPVGLLSADPDIIVANGWESAKAEGNRTVVLFGALKSDPEQGVAVVLSIDPEDEGKILDRTRVLTPEKHGAIRVTTLGAKDFDMTTVAEDGYYWTFNVYNGFSGGQRPEWKASAPVSGVSSGDNLTPFDNDADAQKFQSAAEKFTWAYLSADLTTMKAMLTDPQNGQHDFALKDRSDGIDRLALKVYSDQITPDFIPAQVEIVPKTGDSHDFLYLKIKKVDAEWKVISYALEK